MTVNQRVQQAFEQQRKAEKERRANRLEAMQKKAKIVADHKRKREQTQ